jgi:transcriptional regulator with XRE-family HTH domain
MKMIDKIVATIVEKGFTQAAVERAACLSVNKISKWKDNKGVPKAVELWRIAKVLDTPFEFFIDDASGERPRFALSEDEVRVVETYRDLGLSREEAIVGLGIAKARSVEGGSASWVSPTRAISGGGESDPATASKPKSKPKSKPNLA